VSDSPVALGFHSVAVVSGAFDDPGVFAVADGVEVAFVADPSCQLATGSLLVIRGKKPPDQRPCRR
jgi:hypothetical protein